MRERFLETSMFLCPVLRYDAKVYVFLADKTPLQNEPVIGAISLQLVVSCLHSIEHGSITLAYNDTFRASGDNRAANLKLTGILLNIKVCHRRVLKDCINAVIYH